MKMLFKLLVVSLLMASCSKEDEAPATKPLKNIGGSYEADVNYHYAKDGFVRDTAYKTTVEITEQDSDTIIVQFPHVGNVSSKGKLYFMPYQPLDDTLRYEPPYNYYEVVNFYFAKNSKKFTYKYRVTFTGASGMGGITYTISN